MLHFSVEKYRGVNMNKRKIDEKKFRESLGIKDNIVYHYSSLQALYGIISTRSFWLTSLQSSNDTKELGISKKILDDVMNKEVKEQFDLQIKSIFKNILDSAYDKKYRRYRKITKYYGLSCVNKKDSLVHWDRYGDHGKGVCIGINVGVLDNYIQTKCGEFSTWISQGNIIYKETDQKTKIVELLSERIKFFSSQIKNLNDDPLVESAIYYTTLDSVKAYFKDDGFSDENEYRIVFKENEGEEEAKFNNRIAKMYNKKVFQELSEAIINVLTQLNLLYKNKKFGVFGDMIRGYYSMNLEEIWSDVFIPEIVLGPKCYQDKKELKEFLQYNDLNQTDILISKIPLR